MAGLYYPSNWTVKDVIFWQTGEATMHFTKSKKEKVRIYKQWCSEKYLILILWGKQYLFLMFYKNLVKYPSPSIYGKSSRSSLYKTSHPEVFWRKGVLKICSKFTGKHPCRSMISIKLQSDFIEITLRRGCSPVNLLHIFRIPFPKNTSGRLLLIVGIFQNVKNSYNGWRFRIIWERKAPEM